MVILQQQHLKGLTSKNWERVYELHRNHSQTGRAGGWSQKLTWHLPHQQNNIWRCDGVKKKIPSKLMAETEVITNQSLPYTALISWLPLTCQIILSILIFIRACGHIFFLITTFLGECRSGCIPTAKLSCAPTLAIKDLRQTNPNSPQLILISWGWTVPSSGKN